MKRSKHRHRIFRMEQLESRRLLVGELLAIELDVRQDGESILNDNREFNVQVGERFDLEVLWDDLRPEAERNGVGIFSASIAANLPDSFRPVVSESQVFFLTGDYQSLTEGNLVVGAEDRGNTSTIPLFTSGETVGFADDPRRAIKIAVADVLGIEQDAIEITNFSDDTRLEFRIWFLGDDLALRDIPNLTFDSSGLIGAVVTSEVVEHPAFVNNDPSQGINVDQFLTSVDFRSRSMNDFVVYHFRQDGEYSPTNTPVFRAIEGTTFRTDLAALAASQGVSYTGRHFEAFSIRVEAVAPADGVVFDAVFPDDREFVLFPSLEELESSDVLIDLGGQATVTGTFTLAPPPFQNPNSQFDVNNDGNTTALDILAISQELEQRNFSDPQTGKLPDMPAGEVTLFFDVNGDGFATQDDLNDIFFALSPLDFGDAPNSSQSGFAASYPTARVDGGAAHVVGPLFLGLGVDAEVDGIASLNADFDDATDDDEDGVIAITNFLAGTSIPATVEVIASATGKLDAWIDFDRDGVWDETSERIFAGVELVSGSNFLAFSLPASTQPGDVYARFRFSTDGVNAPTGIASDGEVEDHVFPVVDGSNSADVHVLAGNATSIRLSSELIVVGDGEDVTRLRANLVDVTSLTVTGTEEADTITIEFGGGTPVPVGGLVIDGVSGDDVVVVTGPVPELDLTSSGSVSLQNFGRFDMSDPNPTRLLIDAGTVALLSPVNQQIRIVTQQDTSVSSDKVTFLDQLDWRMSAPIIENTQFILTATNQVSGETVEFAVPHAWQNQISPSDVNNDGSTTASDALSVINELVRRVFSDSESAAVVDPLSVTLWPNAYIDQNGDDQVTALDALRVINELTRQSVSKAENESAVLLPSINKKQRINSIKERWFSENESISPVQTLPQSQSQQHQDAELILMSAQTVEVELNEQAVDQLLSDASFVKPGLAPSE